MKISRLFLKAYGAFTDHCLDFDGGADFHVIYGPNEAGKSTTLRALTGFLFGIEDRTTDNFLHPHPQLRVGATLVAGDGSRVSLMRRKARKHALFALDEDTGSELGDQPLPEETLARLLGGLDEGLYRALFGLDLEGLARGSESLLAGKGEIGQSLFEAAAGLASLRQLTGRLNQTSSALFRSAGKKDLINSAIRELAETRKRAREAGVRPQTWEQADREKRRAEKSLEAIRDELQKLREEYRQLSRIAANLPLAAEREAKLLELETLAAIPNLPPEAAEQRREAEQHLRTALETQREAKAELDRLEKLRTGLQVREALLDQAAAIERLHHAAKEWRSTVERLPRIGQEIEAATAGIAARLAAIGADLTDASEQLARLFPGPTLIARIEALAEQYAAFSAQDTQLAAANRTGTAAILRYRAELDALPVPFPLDDLERARDKTSAHGDLAGQLAKLDHELADLDAAVAREAAALWTGSPDELAGLRVPLATTLREFEDHYRRLDEALREIQAEDERLVRDIGDRERELLGYTAAGEIATHAQVVSAREHRDQAWSLVRRGYIERSENPERLAADFCPGETLSLAFDNRLREADRLADLLHADAGRAAGYTITAQRLAAMKNRCAELAAACEALAGDRNRLDERWTAVAASMGRPDLSPSTAVEWCQRQQIWVGRYGDLAKLRRARQETATSLAMARAALDRAFTGCGLPGVSEDETLAAALLRAKQTVDTARDAATARAKAQAKLAQQELDLKDTDDQQSELAVRLESWREHWCKAMAALRLPATALPAEARARLTELSGLREALDARDGLIREAQTERDKRTAFEQALATLATAIDEPLSGRDADRVVGALYRELATARESDRQRKQWDADVERERGRLRQARTRAESQQERLEELARRAGIASPIELPAVEAEAARKRRLAERVAEIEGQLVANAARPLDQVLAAVEGREIGRTQARVDELDTAIRDREAEREAAHERAVDLRKQVETMDGGDTAARAQQEAEELLARIAGHARSYARTRLAEAVVARVVQAYRERHQGPVLRRAGEIFATFTLGSFTGLTTDYESDAQVLLGRRADGTLLDVAGMSQGTRDQLFLALRIAAIEEHLNAREPIPLVIDDLLVQFDDARAAATLKVLADLAGRTQVLFFTHHRHLCELAAELPENCWRQHDLGTR